jgi:phosphinothricin acetyltransferase
MRDEDGPAVLAIYREGIATGQATFETEVPSWNEWKRRYLLETGLVAEVEEGVTGERVGSGGRVVAAWAALSPVSSRPVYRGVAEEAIYVADAYRGRGVGRTLLRELIEKSEAAGVWTLQAGIFPENTASLRLHAGCGFRRVGVRDRIGAMNGRWRDVVLLERRREEDGPA